MSDVTIQLIGCGIMCFGAGLGLGVVGWEIVSALAQPNCEKCEEEGNPDCLYWGELDGCNNRALRAKVRGWEGK